MTTGWQRVVDATANARRRCGRTAVRSAAAALLLVAPAALPAQTGSGYSDRYTPFGSPLDPLGLQGQGSQQQQQQQQQQSSQSQATNAASTQAAARIEPVEINDDRGTDAERRNARNANGTGTVTAAEETRRAPPPPSEFERYVERAIGRPLPRFGADLLIAGARDFTAPVTATVPQSYILSPGDQIFIGLTGSVDGTIDAEIDTNGRIFVPKVGSVRVAGVTVGALRGVIEKAVGRQYRDFRVSTSVTRLRGLRVYVTGFANNPGGYTVSSLSTLVNAVLAAGGPSAGGSFRAIRLYRNGALVSDFDLYDLIRNGDKSKDAVLQNEDVIFIPAVGRQVALAGSVNAEAIYEARPGETLASLVRYAGGPNALADQSRVILYRLSNLDTIGGREVGRAELAATAAEAGDVVQVLSTGSLARSLERQSVVVRIEGEVNRPGNYYVPPNTSLGEVIAKAGGLTSQAFVFGTNLQRLSVRQQQRESFAEALQQLEISLAAAPLVADTSVDSATRLAQLASARAVIDRLRLAEPDGRVVLNLTPASTFLPAALTLQNSDRLYVPPRPTTIGVFGAVYRPASFLIEPGPKKIKDYLGMVGGPLRVADRGQLFVVRANGSVVSRRAGALNLVAVPGDLVFVPVRTQSTSVLTRILQFSTLAFQFGLTAAAIDGLRN